MKRYSLLIVTHLVCLLASSQSFDKVVSGHFFNEVFPGSNLFLNEDQSFVIAGKTLTEKGLASISLTGYHRSGTLIWTKKFETGEYVDYHISIRGVDTSGYLIIASGTHMLRMIRTDREGNRLWTRNINSGRYEEKNPVLIRADTAGFLVCGTKVLGPEENYRRVISISTIDTSGQTVRERIISDDRHLTLHAVKKLHDGGLLIGGHHGYTYREGSLLYLARTDPEGDTLWTKKFGAVSHVKHTSLLQLKNKQLVVAGTYVSDVGYQDRIFFRWLDRDGNRILSASPGEDMNHCHSVIQTADNGFLLAGATRASGNGQQDILLIKTNILGQTQWQNTFGAALDDIAYEIHETSDSGFIVLGATDSYGQDHTYLLKTNASGKVSCRKDHRRFFTPLVHGVSTDAGQGVITLSYEPVIGDAQILLFKEAAMPGSYLMINSEKSNRSGVITDETALPDLRSYTYYIRVINECGDTSLASTPHSTVFLEAYSGGNDTRNLIWNHYEGDEVSQYVILRGTGKDKMKELDVIPGLNNIYSDIKPPEGTVHYQIKGIIGSYSSYSNIASLIASGERAYKEPGKLHIFPNPVTDDALVSFANPGNSSARLQLFDLSGRLVYEQRTRSGSSMRFHRKGLTDGTYLLVVHCGDHCCRARMVLL